MLDLERVPRHDSDFDVPNLAYVQTSVKTKELASLFREAAGGGSWHVWGREPYMTSGAVP